MNVVKAFSMRALVVLAGAVCFDMWSFVYGYLEGVCNRPGKCTSSVFITGTVVQLPALEIVIRALFVQLSGLV